MSVKYQFNDLTKWQQIWNEDYTGNPFIDVLERYYPIGRVTVNALIFSKVIAVFCANNDAQDN